MHACCRSSALACSVLLVLLVHLVAFGASGDQPSPRSLTSIASKQQYTANQRAAVCDQHLNAKPNLDVPDQPERPTAQHPEPPPAPAADGATATAACVPGDVPEDRPQVVTTGWLLVLTNLLSLLVGYRLGKRCPVQATGHAAPAAPAAPHHPPPDSLQTTPHKAHSHAATDTGAPLDTAAGSIAWSDAPADSACSASPAPPTRTPPHRSPAPECSSPAGGAPPFGPTPALSSSAAVAASGHPPPRHLPPTPAPPGATAHSAGPASSCASGDAGSEASDNLLHGEWPDPVAEAVPASPGPGTPPPWSMPPPGSPAGSLLTSALTGTPPGQVVAHHAAAGSVVPVVVVEHKHVHALDPRLVAVLRPPLQSLSDGFTMLAQQAAVFNTNFSAASGTLAGQLQAVAASTSSLSQAMHTLSALTAQGRLAAKAMQCGLLLHVSATAWFAATRGRLPEISATCASARRLRGVKAWMGGLVPGMQELRVLRCYLRELGEVSTGVAGAVLLIYMWRFTLRGADLHSTWAVDVPVLLGLAAGASGACVVAHLGGSWLVWLLLWWVWCGALLCLCRQRMSGWRQGVVALVVAVALPAAGAVAPFTVAGLRVHGAAKEVLGPPLVALIARLWF